MKRLRLAAGTLLLSLVALPALPARQAKAPPAPGNGPVAGKPAKPAGQLPLCGLAPGKLIPDLCLVRYRISTTSPQCQAFFDQGLGYFYSYVWMEAARSFETALRHDPDCPMAWWGLARALEAWKHGDPNSALLKAHELRARASHREQQLILAGVQEKGLVPGVGDAEARKKAACETLDRMLALYDDDEEGWYFRAQLAGGAGGLGGVVSAVPYYKALLRINPLHPGANHELLHFYEKFQRPALGWVYAENYIKSSPGLPHAFHMQAHLATRLGRWQKTSDRSARAIELERAYHKTLKVAPSDDYQYAHHLEILLVSLTHDGRFAEARAVKAEMQAAGSRPPLPFFRLHLAERDWAEVLRVANEVRRRDKVTASYLSALVYLKQGDEARALPEIEVLRQSFRSHKNDRKLEFRLWETQGLYLCRTGAADVGLKLLARAVERTKNDYSHHAWGNGSYYMEEWGLAALRAGRAAVAEEAYLEALAHDPGSFRAALGLQVLCEGQGRTEEARRYADLARRCWGRAEPRDIEAERTSLRAGLSRAHDTPAGGSGSAARNR